MAAGQAREFAQFLGEFRRKDRIETSLAAKRHYSLSGFCHEAGKPAKNVNRPHVKILRFPCRSGVPSCLKLKATVWFSGNNSLIAQSVERRTVNPQVAGSSPARGAIIINDI